MPNWCENHLVFAGPKAEVDRFYNSFKDDGKMLENNIPTPEELLKEEPTNKKSEHSDVMKQKYGAVDWYWWRVYNWGTKWDIDDFHEVSNHEKDDLKVVEITFNSAWSPPEEGIQKLSELYKNLYFYIQFSEPGMGFEGYAKFMNGTKLEGETVDSYPKCEQIFDDIQYEYDLAINSVINDDETEGN